METAAKAMTLAEIARVIEGDLCGPADKKVSRPVSPDADDPEGIAFAASERYLQAAEASNVGAVVVSNHLRQTEKASIRVRDARSGFARLLAMFDSPLPAVEGVHPTAIVHPTARVDATASIGPYAVVERGAVIGARARVYAHAYVGEECVLEDEAIVYPHAVLYRSVCVGKGSRIHAGSVIGSDGFGYVLEGADRIKVPQVGGVLIGSNVEIGALAAVDRATIGHTLVGDNAKIDNLVQIAHNVALGKNCVIAAQSGISGSAKLGDGVVMGGQCGTSDHVVIAPGAVFAGRSAVLQDVEEPGEYMGHPARPIGLARRALLLFARLPELFARLRGLEGRVKALETSSKRDIS